MKTILKISGYLPMLIGLIFMFTDVLNGQTYDVLMESNQSGAHLGRTVANAGDVNGDGYDDIIAAAIYFDNPESDEGAVFIYHGSVDGIVITPATTIESNVIGAHFGTMVACAGDINGDGYDDVIVGSEDFDAPELQEGRVTVYLGGPSGIDPTPLHILEMNQAGANFGVSVSGQIDVNADGFDDVIVGAQYYDNGQTDEGRVYVFHGSPLGLNITPMAIMESDQPYAYFGREISGAGDVNGDGYDDIIVGADNYDNPESGEGRAYIFHGSPSGILTAPAIILEMNISGANFGTVSRAGDVNGDGYDDVIVGACGGDGDKAYVFVGSPIGIMPLPSTIIKSPTVAYEFYGRVADAGDINNDGYDDVIIGAIYYSNGEYEEGGAFVHLGSVSGISEYPYMSLESNMAFAHFGRSSSGAGDINNDGFDDFIVGAYGYSNGQSEEGALYIYYGELNEGLCAEPPTGLVLYEDPWYWNMLKFKWDAVPGVIAYRVRYREVGSETWNYKYTGPAKNYVVIQYWTCFVDYEVQVMSICTEDGSDVSAYSGSLLFNTDIMDHCYRVDDGVENTMYLYPNPVNENLNISVSNITSSAVISIRTLNGQLMQEYALERVDEELIKWNTLNVPAGVYVIELLTNNILYREKVVVVK